MRLLRPIAGMGLLVVVSCSSEASAPSAPVTSSSTGAATSAKQTLFYFEGAVDVAKKTLTVSARSTATGVTTQAVLPYGATPGDVYFHTCGTPGYSAHKLTASVQAVNLTGANVSGLTAVIDSTTPSTVTPSSGVIADYGQVAPNTASNCGSPNLTWTLNDPSDTSFTFTGHAEGTIGSIFYDDFSSLSLTNPGTQCATGNTVYAFATLSNWNVAGENAIHGVQWQTNNLAAQLYGGDSNGNQNSITMKTGIENVNGKSYTVSFLGGPGNWNSCGQGTTANNNLVFKVTAGAAMLKTFTYQPAVWSNTENLTASSFSYTGNGNGSNAVLSITAGGTQFGTFGGAVDDVSISSP